MKPGLRFPLPIALPASGEADLVKIVGVGDVHAAGRHELKGGECDNERAGAQWNKKSILSGRVSLLRGGSGRDAASACAQVQLERPRHVAETGADWGQIDVLGRPQRLQREALQDGG